MDPVKILEGDYFPTTRSFVENYKKRSSPGPVPKHWLHFSYIHSEEYKLDLNFDVNRKYNI